MSEDQPPAQSRVKREFRAEGFGHCLVRFLKSLEMDTTTSLRNLFYYNISLSPIVKFFLVSSQNLPCLSSRSMSPGVHPSKECDSVFSVTPSSALEGCHSVPKSHPFSKLNKPTSLIPSLPRLRSSPQPSQWPLQNSDLSTSLLCWALKAECSCLTDYRGDVI